MPHINQYTDDEGDGDGHDDDAEETYECDFI